MACEKAGTRFYFMLNKAAFRTLPQYRVVPLSQLIGNSFCIVRISPG
jgi:hypothetical protein